MARTRTSLFVDFRNFIIQTSLLQSCLLGLDTRVVMNAIAGRISGVPLFRDDETFCNEGVKHSSCIIGEACTFRIHVECVLAPWLFGALFGKFFDHISNIFCLLSAIRSCSSSTQHTFLIDLHSLLEFDVVCFGLNFLSLDLKKSHARIETVA